MSVEVTLSPQKEYWYKEVIQSSHHTSYLFCRDPFQGLLHRYDN